ncbi:hypothetical protein [Nitrospira sp. BLG_2]|uniref:hypothetical protein n=1 Tax=Nitrospira sp. BLG_2 TaxID=3397507 RepID=UPI003B995BD9
MSNRAPAVVERMADPFLSLHPSDGDLLHLEDGMAIELRVQDVTYRLAVQLDPSTPSGTAGLSIVHDAVRMRLPAWVNLHESITIDRRVS